MGLFRKGKTHTVAKFQRTDLVVCSHSRDEKSLSCSRITMVAKTPTGVTSKTIKKSRSIFPSKTIQRSRSISKDGSRSLGLFRKGKTHIVAKFQRIDLVVCSHSREEKSLSCSRITMVAKTPTGATSKTIKKSRSIFPSKTIQRSRSILKDGFRSLGLFRKGKTHTVAKFHQPIKYVS